jgi:phage FluMu gp28-like protein
VPDAVLIVYQRNLMTSVAENAVVVYEKSRRIGISWGAGAIAALTAASDRTAGGMDVLYMGYSLEMAREFIDYVAMWGRHFDLAAAEIGEIVFADSDRDIKAFRIQFASGYEVIALSSAPRSLRGKQGLVILDEAAFHDDLEELLKAAFALLLWGGKVLVISTHDGVENPFNALVEDIRAGRKPYKLLRTTFSDAIEDGLYRQICLVRGIAWTEEGELAWEAEIRAFYGSDAEEELDVVPRSGGGVFLPRALIDARSVAGVPVLRYRPPAGFVDWAKPLREAEIRDWCNANLLPLLAELDPKQRHYFGEDFGRHGDLSVIWPLALGQDLVRRTPFVLELRDVPFEAQAQILFFIVDRLPRFMASAMDSGGNGMYLGEVARQRYGASRVAEIKFSEAWYRDNMPRYKAAFEGGSIEIPKDADILTDHTLIKMEKGVAKIPAGSRTRGADGGDRHGDSAIAGALAYHASLMEVTEIEFQSVPRSEHGGSPRGGNLNQFVGTM